MKRTKEEAIVAKGMSAEGRRDKRSNDSKRSDKGLSDRGIIRSRKVMTEEL